MNLQNNEHTGSASSKRCIFLAKANPKKSVSDFKHPRLMDERSYTKNFRFNALPQSYEFPMSVFFSPCSLRNIEFKQSQIIPIKVQIENLRKKMGFNISEIAEILLVARPTIYDWLELEDIKLHYANQQRLNLIYEFFINWDSQNLGRISSYLYKILSNEHSSLFELLKAKDLDKQRIYNIIDQIQYSIKMQHTTDNSRMEFLKNHGFEEVSKDAREDNLNNFIRSVGLNEKNHRKD